MRTSNVGLRLQPSLLEEARKVAQSEGTGIGNPPMPGDELPKASMKVVRRRGL